MSDDTPNPDYDEWMRWLEAQIVRVFQVPAELLQPLPDEAYIREQARLDRDEALERIRRTARKLQEWL
jgi:hypothetical protein